MARVGDPAPFGLPAAGPLTLSVHARRSALISSGGACNAHGVDVQFWCLYSPMGLTVRITQGLTKNNRNGSTLSSTQWGRQTNSWMERPHGVDNAYRPRGWLKIADNTLPHGVDIVVHPWGRQASSWMEAPPWVWRCISPIGYTQSRKNEHPWDWHVVYPLG